MFLSMSMVTFLPLKSHIMSHEMEFISLNI